MSDYFYIILYDFYTPGHIVLICLTFFLLFLTCVLSFRRKQLEKRMLWAGFISTFVLELSLIIYSALTKEYNLEWYVPLHICNLFLLVYPVALIFKGKVRNFLKDYIVFCGIGGCVIANVFPITTLYYYPAAHIVSLLVWAYHMTIGIIGCYFLFSGNYKKLRCFNVLSILTVLIAAAYFVNQKLDTNFVFINPNWDRFPLNIFYNIFGKFGVWIVIGSVYVSLIGMQIAFYVFNKVKVQTFIKICQKSGLVEYFKKSKNKIVHSSVYEYLMTTSFIKNLKKDKIVNKLAQAVASSNVIAYLTNAGTDEYLHLAELIKQIKKSGVIDNIYGVITYKDIKQIQKAQNNKALA